MMRIATAVLAVTCGAVCLGHAFSFSKAQKAAAAPDPVMVHAGQDVFNKYCFQCHSMNEGQNMLGPSLYAEMRKPHPKKTPAEVRMILQNGKGKMPSFADRLTAMDTDNLLAYLRTL